MLYNICILTIADFRKDYCSNFYNLKHSYNLKDDLFEYLYDGVVLHALNNVCRTMGKGIIKDYNSPTDDMFLVIYADLNKFFIELSIKQQLESFNINFYTNECLKALVAGDALIIARSYTSIER